MAIAGRRAVGILNRTDASTQIKISWEKLGLTGAPKSLRGVWTGQNVETADGTVSVPAHDLALMIVDGDDESPQQYSANGDSFTGMKAMRGPAFARLQYANNSGHVVVVPVKSTSGLSTSLALPPTVGSEIGTIGLILPHGTADLLFDQQPIAVRKLDVYAW